MAHSRITQRRSSHPSTAWSQSTGMAGRNALERLVAINRNHWSQWTGTGIAATSRKKRALARPETFDFLGFTFICGKSRQGRFQLQRKTRGDRMRAKLRDIKVDLRRRMHWPIPEQGKWLRQIVSGHYAYFAVPTNIRALTALRYHVVDLWRQSLRRRSQKDGATWERITKIANEYLPSPRILHPWPSVRFAVKHPR